MRTGRGVRHTHDYRRHGIVDLYAALEVATRKVTHAFSTRDTAADFLGFLKKVVRTYPAQELHVVLDNSSTHNTPQIHAWLQTQPRMHFHYTPTSASWLNQIEGFFGILTKQSLSITDFASKRALQDHLLIAYLRAWNNNPTPFEWTKPARAIITFHKRMLIGFQRRCTRSTTQLRSCATTQVHNATTANLTSTRFGTGPALLV